MLSQLIGIEDLISIQIEGFDPVFPIANEDLPRSTEEKTSAVHFLRYEFTDDMIAAAKAGSNLSVACGHDNYQHRVDAIADDIRQSLVRDFD